MNPESSRRTITEHEMSRRRAMAAAQSRLTEAMQPETLTVIEWLCVLQELQARVLAEGLAEERKQ